MKEVVENWLNEMQTALVAKYREVGVKDTGNYENQLETKLTENSSGFKAQILGANYAYWLEHGRKAGKRPPMSVIQEWVERKFTVENPRSLAYVIARKIGEKGIQVPNKYNKGGIVSDVINDKAIQTLTKRLGTAVIENVKSDVIKQWQ